MRNLNKLNLIEMKNILTTLLLSLSIVSFSQTKVQLEIENKNGKEQYKIKLEREVDGKKVITEKTYSNKEELKNDSNLEGLSLHIMEGDVGHLPIKVDAGASNGDHKIMFISNNEGGEEANIEVTVDEYGTKHIFKNGEEVDVSQLHSRGDNVFMLKSDGNDSLHIEELMKVEVTIDKDKTHLVTVNGKNANYEEWVKGTEYTQGKHLVKKIIIHKGGEEGQKEMKYEVMMKRIVLHIEEVSAVDEKAFSIEKNKALKLDEFNFYPNPNNGTFNLKFAGKEKSTIVRITAINGKEVYAEDLQNFTGIYDKKINLSDLKKGIYLLQVVQGSKAINKKIIIE